MPSLILGSSTPLTITSVLGGTGRVSLLSSPEEAVVAGNGTIFVADTLNHRIAVFNAQGKLVQSTTDGPGSPLSAPFAIALLPNGNPLVLDSELGQLIEYNLQGKVVRSSIRALGLVHARGLAVSPSGQILIANTPRNEIDVLDSSFTITHREVGQPAGQPLDFIQPAAIAYGPDGSIYVLDSGNNRVIQYTSGWQKLRTLPAATTDTLHSPRVLALPDGRVLATDPRDSTLLVYAPHASEPRVYALGAAQGPLGIALDGSSKLLITCSGSNQVLITSIPTA
jgi:DNA-binding beta-propeller fold protein YncE